MESGDIVCLEGDIQGRGVLPSHFRDFSDTQFNQHYGITKEKWFVENGVAAMVYIRPTTKKHGRNRSLIAPDRGKNSQLAVFNDEIFGVGSYEFTKVPDRWCPIFESYPNCPEGGGHLKPVKDGNRYTAWSPQRQEYLQIPTRWDRNLFYCRPFQDPKWEDFEMELLPAAPGVNGVNFRVNGGGSKTGRPKLGAGVRLFNAKHTATFPECQDNRYLKHESKQHPRDAEEWYVPWGEFRPKFRYHDDQVIKGSLTINFPVTGIGKLVAGIKPKVPRGRITTPRPQEQDDDYYNPQGSPVKANPFSTHNTPNNYNPQGLPAARYAAGAPNSLHGNYNTTMGKSVEELMKKLMDGQVLSTEELTRLQRLD